MKKAIYAQKAEAIISRLDLFENDFMEQDNIDPLYNIAEDLELLLFKFSRFYPSLYEIRKAKVRIVVNRRMIGDFDVDKRSISSLRIIALKFIDFLKDE